MTIKEYNKEFSVSLDHARVFVESIDHAIQKTNDYEDVAKQLACIGWNNECKNVILAALIITIT